jgi:deoxyguanosine kinase
MNIAFLSLGGNIGNRRENLRKAIEDIESTCGSVKKTSTIFETEPWGTNSSSPYYNMVVKLKTALSATELMEKILFIEEKLGRKRNGPQYSDRTIDIDILFFNSNIITQKRLQVPHPRIEQRKFVLVPLNEIAPDFIHPVLNKPVKSLLRACKDKLKVTAVKTLPPLTYLCVEGNIGSGKTTLAKLLSKRFKGTFLPESFEENNLLPLFYNDQKLYSFPLEYSFLISRFEQITALMKEERGLIVSDFSFFKSLWFARVNLSEKEFRMFKKHFIALSSHIKQADLLIYLDTDISNLEQNIEKRGRSYEQDIKRAYLKKLNKSYTKGIDDAAPRVLRLYVADYQKEPEKKLILEIEKYIKENFG